MSGSFDIVITCTGQAGSCPATTVIDETEPFQSCTTDGWHRSGLAGTHNLCPDCLAAGADRRFERSRHCQTCGNFRCYADSFPLMSPQQHTDGEIHQCVDCPPKPCERCGEMDSHREPCSCWISLKDMALADIKALFARDGGFELRHSL